MLDEIASRCVLFYSDRTGVMIQQPRAAWDLPRHKERISSAFNLSWGFPFFPPLLYRTHTNRRVVCRCLSYMFPLITKAHSVCFLFAVNCMHSYSTTVSHHGGSSIWYQHYFKHFLSCNTTVAWQLTLSGAVKLCSTPSDLVLRMFTIEYLSLYQLLCLQLIDICTC